MTATYKQLDNGDWGVRTDGRCGLQSIADVKPGVKVIVTKKNGCKVHDVELGTLVDTDNDLISIWTIANPKKSL